MNNITEGKQVNVNALNNDLAKAMIKAGFAPVAVSEETFADAWVDYTVVCAPLSTPSDIVERVLAFCATWIQRHGTYCHRTSRPVFACVDGSWRDFWQKGVAFQCTGLSD